MRYVVTYRRTPIQLPDGRWTTDSFLVRDRASVPVTTSSTHATRVAAVVAAAALNDS
ncbi:MAG: hypothetical protein QOJ13_1240 [Gaiellales bacterium]|jgi:hypothetical protein|nr:hypothetical protein [Gaiellales bacterium]